MSIAPFPQQPRQHLLTQVALEPVRQILLSMAQLTGPQPIDEHEEWMQKIAVQLTDAEQQFNQLLFGPLLQAIWRQLDEPSFPDYLARLQALDATLFVQPIQPGRVAATRTISANSGDDLCTDTIKAEITALLADAPALQQQVIDHLRMLWQVHFAKPWEKQSKMMDYIARELNGRAWPTSSANAIIRAFLRRPVPEWLAGQLGDVERIIFVPSPYLHFQAARLPQSELEPPTIWIFLWADFWIWPMRTEPIQRTEVLRAISALDDETRLQILEMVAATDEVRAQEMIAQLTVSQSTVSRHLKQLVNAGFLNEERAGDTNKIYRLQRERIGEVNYALAQLLSVENAQMVLTDVRLEQPAALRPFLDRDGLVTSWPAKRKGQEAVLAYLITKFATEERYTEKAVNELLNTWHTYNDPAYLRRCLVDERLLLRTADGAQYWRKEQ